MNRQGPFLSWFFEKSLGWKDFGANILLFAPFGFAVGWRMQNWGFRRPASLALTVLASAAFSFCIELTQNFMPTRDSSWFDVLANTAGGPLGWIVFRMAGESIGRVLSSRAALFLRMLNPKLLALIFCAYMVLAIAVSIPLSRSAMLSNWDLSYPLVLGNVSYGGHPWRGQIFKLAIADRAVKPSEIERLFREGFAPVAGSNVVASYQLGKSTASNDESGLAPALRWKPRTPPDEEGLGVRFTRDGPWLQTEGSASGVESRIRGTNQFSLYIECETDQSLQPGLNPIVALGPDLNRNDFLLGQFYSSLVFHLRTPMTGPGGEVAEFDARWFFETIKTRRILLTYDGATLRSYFDGKAGFAPELGPGSALFQHVRWVRQYDTTGYKALYYALIFVPLGCILALATRTTDRVTGAMIACGLILPGAILEPTLATVSHRPFHFGNLLLAIALAAVSFAFVRRYLPR
jgi:hypothetical protein